jgi:histidine triad (HIT) family protein
MVGCVADCVFCAVVAGSLKVHVVLDEPAAVAFLDHRPVFKGHVLIVPRPHLPTLADLPSSDLAPYFAVVQRLAMAVQTGLDAEGTFVALNNTISQSVPHLHTHVVPRRKKDGLRGFFWPRTKYSSDEEAADYAARVRAAVTPP